MRRFTEVQLDKELLADEKTQWVAGEANKVGFHTWKSEKTLIKRKLKSFASGIEKV